MKKIFAVLTAVLMAEGLAGCGESVKHTVENNSSQLYTDEDMDIGLRNISERMVKMQTELDRVSYLGDEYCTNKEVLENINRLEMVMERGLEGYTECIGFSVDAHYPKTPDVVFEHAVNGDWAYIRMPKLEDLTVLYARVGDGAWEEVYVGDHDILVHFD